MINLFIIFFSLIVSNRIFEYLALELLSYVIQALYKYIKKDNIFNN